MGKTLRRVVPYLRYVGIMLGVLLVTQSSGCDIDRLIDLGGKR
jgi:hypothetical protein